MKAIVITFCFLMPALSQAQWFSRTTDNQIRPATFYDEGLVHLSERSDHDNPIDGGSQQSLREAHRQFSQWMIEVAHFMKAKGLRLDSLDQQKVYSPEVLRPVLTGPRNEAQADVAFTEVRDKAVRGYFERRESAGSDTMIFRGHTGTQLDGDLWATIRAGNVYVLDTRATNYIDSADWFSDLDRAYLMDQKASSIPVEYQSYVSIRMKSLLGFRNFSHFLAGLVITKGFRDAAYMQSLEKAVHDATYFADLLSIANGKFTGTQTENRLAYDLAALLSRKRGHKDEMARAKIASYPEKRSLTEDKEIQAKAREQMRGTYLERLIQGTSGKSLGGALRAILCRSSL